MTPPLDSLWRAPRADGRCVTVKVAEIDGEQVRVAFLGSHGRRGVSPARAWLPLADFACDGRCVPLQHRKAA